MVNFPYNWDNNVNQPINKNEDFTFSFFFYTKDNLHFLKNDYYTILICNTLSNIYIEVKNECTS